MRATPPPPEAIVRALTAVAPLDPLWAARAAERQSRLTMPPGSLGRLLELGRQLAAIQRTEYPAADPALVAVFAADHGIASAGVSAYPAEVTGQMVANYLAGGAAVNVLARRVGAIVRVADFGVKHWPGGARPGAPLIDAAVGPGTASFADGPAMTRTQAFQAVQAGLDLGEVWAGRDGFRVMALGEMGIGNTTSASALAAVLTGQPAERMVGRGTGVDDLALTRKIAVVESAMRRHAEGQVDVWDWLARLGGFEILGLAGLAISAAAQRTIVVLDGLISSTAGLVATVLCPPVREYLVAAHVGSEPGHRIVLESLNLRPLLDLDLRLGEGTGATLALPLIASAADILRDMATFDSAGVSKPT